MEYTMEELKRLQIEAQLRSTNEYIHLDNNTKDYFDGNIIKYIRERNNDETSWYKYMHGLTMLGLNTVGVHILLDMALKKITIDVSEEVIKTKLDLAVEVDFLWFKIIDSYIYWELNPWTFKPENHHNKKFMDSIKEYRVKLNSFL